MADRPPSDRLSTAADWPAQARETVERHGVRAYPDAPPSVPGLLAARADEAARPALVELDGSSLSIAELWERTDLLAGALQQRYGLQRGERVGLLFANGLDFCVALLGVLRAGGVAIPLNTKYAGSELAERLIDAGARVLLGAAEWWGKFEPYRASTPLAEVALAGGAGGDRFEELADPGFDEPALSPDDPALLVYTSGTTGSPKGAMLSHGNCTHAALTYARCLELEPDDTTVIAVPLFHVTGLMGQLLPVLAAGGSACILPRFHAEATVALLADGAASFFHAAPSVYLLVLGAAHGQQARGLRLALCGGGATPPPMIERVQAFAPGVDFRTVYGLTETSSPATLMPAGWLDRKPKSSGIAVPIDSVRVDAPLGEPGEVLVAGATVVRGYFHQPKATGDVFGGGWLRTGDTGRLDADGFLTITDRLKDMINRGGEKISSLEVERVLYLHSAVAECAVVAQRDPTYGEVPIAYVIPRVSIDQDELREFAATMLAKFERPTAYHFVADLPHNDSGKILKNQLRQRTTDGSSKGADT